MSHFGDLLIVPKPCKKVLLDKFHSFLLAGHFDAKKVCSSFSGHV